MSKKVILILLSLCFTCSSLAFAQEKLKEAVVSAKIPKRLRTFEPFWGVPVLKTGVPEEYEALGNFLLSRKDSSSVPRWICWNLDLASIGEDRYKFSGILPQWYKPNCIGMMKNAIDECYRWAWRQPYGNTCITMGPLYSSRNPFLPYAWFVSVCKKEGNEKPLSLGFSSIAFVIPETATIGGCEISQKGNIYQCSMSVNAVEYHSNYNLFPKLPAHIQEQVEELTGYELFCPFQELDENLFENLYVEFERDIYVDIETTVE